MNMKNKKLKGWWRWWYAGRGIRYTAI